MTVTGMWLQLELRRRWRSIAVLALLVALSSGTVFAALAGARRGASAQERLDRLTLPSTAMVLANTPGFDWGRIRRLPEVTAMSTFVVDYNMTSVGVSGDGMGFPPGDANMYRTIEQPVIFAGRALNPARADEVMVSRKWAAVYHRWVGDTLTVVLATPQEVVNQEGSGPRGAYTGPRLTLHIVGVGEVSPSWGVDEPGGHGGVALSPGLMAKYSPNVVGPPGQKTLNYINALVRLRGGAAALPAFTRHLTQITGRSDIEVTDLIAQQEDAQRHIAFESRCLIAFALAAFLAAVFLVGQAVARYAGASTEELRTLRALGMTPRQGVRTAVVAPSMAGVLGAAIGVGGAVIASNWLPMGTAGLLEPSPGFSWDWVVFGPGLVVVPALVAVAATVASYLAIGRARRERAHRRSVVAAIVGQGRLPVPVVVGTRFALEVGRGRTAVPVRPALVGAVLGVLGVLAAFTFANGVSDASTHPERFGQTYQVGAFMGINGNDFGPSTRLLAALRANPSVSAVDNARTAVASAAGTRATVSLWEYSGGGSKALPVVILSGRLPESADEIVLGPRSLSALHTSVGAELVLTGNRDRAVHFRIVGSGLVPTGPHNGYAEGGWLTTRGYDALFRGFKFHLVLVALAADARGPHAAATLTAALVKRDKSLRGLELGAPDPLPEIAELKEVEQLPILLGGFLALLAVGAIGHALATAVRRRSLDFAVLRALGMTQRQCRWVVVTQASVLAVVGLVFGVPLGLAVGRSLWRVVANYTPIAYVPPVAVLALLLIAPGAMLLANLLAAWPGRRAARLRVAHILRAE